MRRNCLVIILNSQKYNLVRNILMNLFAPIKNSAITQNEVFMGQVTSALFWHN